MREYRQFYINGEWVDPARPNSFDVINPATEEVCAHISLGSEEDVNRAVAAARAAFESYSRTSVKERIELLESCAAVYQKRYNDIADAIREEMGAPQELAAGAQAFCGLGHLQQAAKGFGVSDMRVAFYGMKEFDMVDPSGHVLWFGQETDEDRTVLE